jgi:hypothetical protein
MGGLGLQSSAEPVAISQPSKHVHSRDSQGVCAAAPAGATAPATVQWGGLSGNDLIAVRCRQTAAKNVHPVVSSGLQDLRQLGHARAVVAATGAAAPRASAGRLSEPGAARRGAARRGAHRPMAPPNMGKHRCNSCWLLGVSGSGRGVTSKTRGQFLPVTNSRRRAASNAMPAVGGGGGAGRWAG